MSKYYIISLKNTKKKESFFTLWRPDNAGYCWFKDNAGIYDGYEKGYHDSNNNIPVLKDELDKLFTEIEYEGKMVKVVLNNTKNRKILGIKHYNIGRDI